MTKECVEREVRIHCICLWKLSNNKITFKRDKYKKSVESWILKERDSEVDTESKKFNSSIPHQHWHQLLILEVYVPLCGVPSI